MAAALLLAGCGGEAPEANMSAEEIGAQLANMRIEPGLWELTSEVVDVTAPNLPREVRSRMIGPRSRLRHCITPQEAARPSANFLAARGEGGCAYQDLSAQGGRIGGTMTCGYIRTTMAGSYGPTAYDTRMEMISAMPGGGEMILDVRARGRRIGDCPEGAKQ